ncbi:MAG: hypothetical protein B0W54_24185 [Cellvibrio sp. 79]|nr:MAG: hypothetical protein B0W54_24185 [Cellvibrio sp. 79]
MKINYPFEFGINFQSLNTLPFSLNTFLCSLDANSSHSQISMPLEKLHLSFVTTLKNSLLQKNTFYFGYFSAGTKILAATVQLLAFS